MENPVNMLLVFGLMFGSWILLIRWLTGWSKLESKFRCERDSLNTQISQGSFRWVHSRVRFTELGLAVELYPAFLWLRPGFPLTFGMKAICVPWHQIEDVKLKKSILGTGATLNLGEWVPPIYIRGEAGKRIHASFVKDEENSSNDV